MIPICLVNEDFLSESVMVRLVNNFGDKYVISATYSDGGFGYIKANLDKFNSAAKVIPYFVLTDLDNTPCATELIQDWIKFRKHSNLIFRIAVTEVESWLLADRKGFANYLGISIANMPRNPDLERDPKQSLISLVNKSKRRDIKSDVIPRHEAQIGPNYNGRLSQFVIEHWDIERAAKNSESLKRAINALENFKYVPPRNIN